MPSAVNDILKSGAAASSGALAGGFLDALLALGGATAAAGGVAAGWPVAILGSLCAAGVWAHARLEGKADEEQRRAFERRFNKLLSKCGDVDEVLRRVAARQLDAELDMRELADAADDVRGLLAAAGKDRHRAEAEHQELLVYVGRHLDERLDEGSREVRALRDFASRRLEEVEANLGRKIQASAQASADAFGRAEASADHRHRESTSTGELILQKLDALSRPSIDVEQWLADAVARAREHRYADSRSILDRLLSLPPDKLTGSQRRRAIHNAAVIESRVGETTVAGRMFLDAANAEPGHRSAETLRATGSGMLGRHESAWTHAQAAVRAEPGEPNAWAAWVQAAPEDMPLSEVEAAVPAELCESGGVAHALGTRAQRASIFDEAARLHRRGRGDPELGHMCRINLGISLVKAEQARLRREVDRPRLSSDAAGRAREGVVLLEAELSADRPWLDDVERSRLHTLVGLGYRLLGDDDNANRHAREAHVRDPTEVEAALVHCEELIAVGRTDEAISDLRRLVGGVESSPAAAFAFADALVRRGRQGDRDEAAAVLVAAASLLTPDDELLVRLELARLFATTVPGAADRLAGFNDGVLPAAARDAAVALAKAAAAGDTTSVAIEGNGEAWSVAAPRPRAIVPPECRDATEKAAAALDDDDEQELILWVADALHDLAQHDLALSAYRRVLADHPSPGRRAARMLRSARLIGDERFVLDFCRAAREAGRGDAFLASSEVDVLVRYGAGDEAAVLLRGLLAATPDGPHARDLRYRRAALGLMLGREDLLESDPARLPTPEEAGPGVGCGVAAVLRAGGRTVAAAEYAYRLWRLFPSHAAVADTLVQTAHPAVAPAAGPAASDAREMARKLPAVTDGCAVKIRVDLAARQGAKEVWHVIEPAADNSPLPGELTPGSPLARRMLGLKPDDPFAYSEIGMFGVDEGTVLAVLRPEAGRAVMVAESFRDRFPEAPAPIETMTLPEKADGELDAEAAWRTFDALARQDEERIAAAMAMVNERDLPAAMLCSGLHKSAAEVVSLYQGRREPRLAFCRGTPGEVPRAEEEFAAAEELVLEPIAAAFLYSSGVWRRLGDPPRPLVVSRGTVEELRRLRRKMGEAQSAEAHMVHSAGRVRFVDNTLAERAERARWIGDLDGFLGWVGNHAAVENGLALLDVEPEKRHLMLEAFGRPAAESLALACRTGRLLWCDDARLADYARDQLAIASAWSEAVIVFGYDGAAAGRPSGEHPSHHLDAWLCRNRFTFTRIAPATVARAAAEADWNPDSPDLRRLLDGVLDTRVELDGFIWLAAHVAVEVVRDAPSLHDARGVILPYLDRLALKPWGVPIIRALERHAVDLVADNVAIALRLRLLVQAWAIRWQH